MDCCLTAFAVRFFFLSAGHTNASFVYWRDETWLKNFHRSKSRRLQRLSHALTGQEQARKKLASCSPQQINRTSSSTDNKQTGQPESEGWLFLWKKALLPQRRKSPSFPYPIRSKHADTNVTRAKKGDFRAYRLEGVDQLRTGQHTCANVYCN
jgi:hypothetical protein